MVTKAAHAAGRKVGLCGQAPNDHPKFAEFLADIGLDSISVTADADRWRVPESWSEPGARGSRAAMTDTQVLYANIASNIVALLMLLLSWRWRSVGRFLSGVKSR
jgi:hypothetical protein